ncbi:Uncharacterised protein [Mycolicibacterium flavescens]|uniref:hypothetical protein n=1 Tax=Mycobacterium neumannii TaxID=2048551 RepID=UPI000B93C626|nr:hypothetical protein [Mycobacterium neumannii]VEG40442.1 Uncharacterised protein [Mycolicibacterium flavescens]
MVGGDSDGFALVDWERSACLCDVGSAGYVIALCVTSTGEEVAWLVNEARMRNGETFKRDNGDQLHERLGRLPVAIRERVSPAPRCGQPTRAGTPCRLRVKAMGQACGLHTATVEP